MVGWCVLGAPWSEMKLSGGHDGGVEAAQKEFSKLDRPTERAV